MILRKVLNWVTFTHIGISWNMWHKVLEFGKLIADMMF